MDRSKTTRSLIILTAIAWTFLGLYWVFPLDVIPDVIPFLGWIDDLLGLSGTAALTIVTLKRLSDDGMLTGVDTHRALREPYEPVDAAEVRGL